jgi:hypothetical protein
LPTNRHKAGSPRARREEILPPAYAGHGDAHDPLVAAALAQAEEAWADG